MKRIFICKNCGIATIEGENNDENVMDCSLDGCDNCGSKEVRIFIGLEMKNGVELSFMEGIIKRELADYMQ